MNVTTTLFKHCDLIKVSGRIDRYTAPQFIEAFKSITDTPRFKIVCDMSEVNYMSSAGMRVLITNQKKCKRYNRGEVVLVNVSPFIFEAMELAGFSALFKFFNDSLVAVGYF